LRIEVPDGPLTPAVNAQLEQAFFKVHERAYGYAALSEPTEVVNLRMTAIGKIRRPELRRLPQAAGDSSVPVKGERALYFNENGARTACRIYDRYKLLAGHRVDGPAIVEELDATTV